MKLLPHNRKAFVEIMHYFNIKKKTVLYVAGVGTGKTYVTKELITRRYSKRKIIYVTPTLDLSDYLLKEAGLAEFKNIEFVTYNRFLDLNTGYETIKDAALVVLDEAHHLGSAIAGTNLQKLFYMTQCDFLGLTATPLRDDGVNIKTMFNACVTGLTHFEAIRMELMPKFTYFICSPNLDKLTFKNREKLHINYESSMQFLESMLRIVPRNKWLVFCSNIEQLENSVALITHLFPDYKVLKVYSTSDEDATDVLDELRNSEKAVLLSCDMLLEGFHVPDVEGILLFRNVQSIVTFQQILGRICSMNKMTKPVVIDCTRTAYRIFKRILKEDSISYYNKYLGEKDPKLPHNILDVSLEHSDIYDTMKLLEKINNSNKLVITENDIFASQQEYLISMGVNPSSVYKRCLTKNEDIVTAANAIVNRNTFVVKDKDYVTPNLFCKTYDITYATLEYIMSREKLSINAAAEYWLDTSAFHFEGEYFKSVRHACKHYEVNYTNVLRCASTHSISKADALYYYVHGKGCFVYNQICYKSPVECCKRLKVPYTKIKKVVENNPDKTWQAAITEELALKTKSSKRFHHNGIDYNSPTDCCRKLCITLPNVRQIQARRNIDIHTAIDIARANYLRRTGG